MRRSALVALALLCLGAASAAAGPGGRVVDKAYQTAEIDPGGSIHSSNGVSFRPRATERSVAVTIEDASGTAVPARVTQDLDGDGEYEVESKFCGATDQPVEIEGGAPVTIWMTIGTCNGLTSPGDVGAWIQGTMTATFFR